MFRIGFDTFKSFTSRYFSENFSFIPKANMSFSSRIQCIRNTVWIRSSKRKSQLEGKWNSTIEETKSGIIYGKRNALKWWDRQKGSHNMKVAIFHSRKTSENRNAVGCKINRNRHNHKLKWRNYEIAKAAVIQAVFGPLRTSCLNGDYVQNLLTL